MTNNGIIILTSIGLSAENITQEFQKHIPALKNKSVAIVTTAAEGKEENKYSKIAKTQFEELGFETIDFVDLEANPETDFERYQVIYVCGGNTFKLLKYAKEANFDESIKKLLDREGVYIGVSAGSLILGPSIKIAGTVLDDENEVGLDDLSGFNMVYFVTLPHYSEELKAATDEFEDNEKVTIERIGNMEGIVLEKDQVRRI